MNEDNQSSTEATDTMGKIMLKLTALTGGCIVAAWAIVKLLGAL
jgi:hypothetical protein